ncbi:MAG: hydrogenase small subunit [Planctomycetes bacterium]|nr:hydrogenase small subunit [Planctomycetota bacterium]
MSDLNRREFLQWAGKLAAVMGMSAGSIPKIAEALQQLSLGQAPVLWLQGLSCAGCSVSLLNSEHPGITEIVTQNISLKFHPTISAATGHTAIKVINDCIEKGDYFLIVEGSVPAGMPQACLMGEEVFTDQLLRAARPAKAVISVGTCASFGGIPAGQNNPTGAVSVGDFLTTNNIQKTLINVPGCPSHPDWVTGTLVHVLKFGVPSLDDLMRPKMFYGKLLHDQCPRFADFSKRRFAKKLTDEGCLFMLGCQGVSTHADCSVRFWNSGVNSCIHAGAPCVGCAAETFAKEIKTPSTHRSEYQLEEYLRQVPND